MEQLSTVIFDLDGTLANTLPLCIRAFRASVEPLANRVFSDSEIIATFGPSEEGTIMALAPDHYEQGVERYLRYYEEFHTMCPTVFEGIPALLDMLKRQHVALALVTGKGPISTRISLEYFGLNSYFDVIETGSPAGPVKVRGIKRVLEALEIKDKETVIYVGDAPSDISASREAGVPVIAAAWADTTDAEALKAMNPDGIFYSVGDFSAWVERKLAG
ncbi:HAD family hydrolase [Parapedobacter sp. ISTM3]|uniref:HAD family hydrolase n=1 Tax=Parapedobacter sp. ISTM3 TaxID=2800130 RepID=UPI0019040CF8|nr:HAD family hydrolase [Parapedobacter sp. ISTM3]MBK1442148.1 HAD family hydrolase [Parapedobacter sp. ISTM3]